MLMIAMLLAAAAPAAVEPLPEAFEVPGVETTELAAREAGLKRCGGPGQCVDYYQLAFYHLKGDWDFKPQMRSKIRDALVAEAKGEGMADWWAASNRVYGKKNPIYDGPSAMASRAADKEAASSGSGWHSTCKTKVTKKGNYKTSCWGY